MRGSVWALFLACGLGLYGGAFFLLQPDAPDAAVVEAAARRVLERVGPDELVLILPHYAQGPRRWLGHLQPVASVAPEGEDFEVAPAVWLFGQFGAEREAKAQLEARGWSSSVEWAEGGVRVLRLENPRPWRRLWDLEAALEGAKVEHLYDGMPEPCRQRRGRPIKFGCKRESAWLYISPEWHRMGDHLRRCLWAHPPGKGALRLTVADVPKDGVLRVQGGHTLQSSTRARASVMLDVDFEGAGGGRLEFELKDTWRPFRLPVPPTATGTVSFTVWSPDPGANHFCFVADVRRPEGGA